MPGPITTRSRRPSRSLREDAALTEPGSPIQLRHSKPLPHQQRQYFAESLSCVLYECNAAFEFIYLSENSSELLRLDSNELIGSQFLSDQRIPAEDLIFLSNRFRDLEGFHTKTSLMHRILDIRGLPIWVAHSFWKDYLNDTTTGFRGCIVPMDYSGRLNSSEQAVISRFVHKIGNHFQLLNLVVNSLKRTIPESREILLLQETVEKAIEHTRGFSDYNQIPTCLSRVELAAIVQATAMTRRSSFERKGIAFESQIEASVKGASIQADPYLLELAIGHVLQNALEATEGGGQVRLQARMGCPAGSASAASVCISIVDSGSGIDENALSNVVVPFFTSKKNHDGLGLSMASRFIEIHGGILRVTSRKGKGTEVEIVLPIEIEEQSRGLV